MTYHSIFLVSCMHTSYETSSEIFNAEFISKGQEIWEINGKLELVPWRTLKKNSNIISGRWEGNWPDWQICLRTWRFILEAHHPCQINRSLDHSSRLRAICHAKLIASTYFHGNMLMCQAAFMATCWCASTHSSTCFHGNILTCRSAKRLKGWT